MQNSTIKMKAIPNDYGDSVIEFGRINPFANVCKETGDFEFVNIVTIYHPDDKLIEIGSYRKFFDRPFNLHIEGIAKLAIDEIVKTVNPKRCVVKVFLEGNEDLTDWNVTMKYIKR